MSSVTKTAGLSTRILGSKLILSLPLYVPASFKHWPQQRVDGRTLVETELFTGVLMAGKKILNGEFNLTRISFPIKCMCPKSIL